MAIQLTDVLEDPAGTARRIEDAMAGVHITSVRAFEDTVILNVAFDALPELADFPAENVRIRIHRSGELEAVPGRSDRPWEHRERPRGPEGYGGALCLYYVDDPRELRWSWEDGLEEYIHIVRRHLIFEEWFRRTGDWPTEDAPHGRPAHGKHPIRTAELRKDLARWR